MAISYNGGPVIALAKKYIADPNSDPVFVAKIRNLVCLSMDESKYFHLKTLLRRAGIELPDEG